MNTNLDTVYEDLQKWRQRIGEQILGNASRQYGVYFVKHAGPPTRCVVRDILPAIEDCLKADDERLTKGG